MNVTSAHVTDDKARPVVLIAATSHWFPAARLAVALAKAGCVVDAICPANHPLCSTRAVRRMFIYSGLTPLRSFLSAIRQSEPDLIIPADDLAAREMYKIYRNELNRGGSGTAVCAAIERSFGAPSSFPIVFERATFMKIAEELGVRVPRTAPIANLDVLQEQIAGFGFPLVLKSDGSSGGNGVRIAQTQEEAERAFRALEAPPLLARAAKRALFDRDRTLLWPSLLRRRSLVSAQAFVAGQEATSTVACWHGSVLAALHFEVVKERYAAGPATVLRLTENPEMVRAVEKMVKRLGLSGLHGFDFMLDSNTRNAYLIEINPRTTQVGHVQLGAGRDLPAALVAALSGAPIQPAPKATENNTIALFPQEWMRDPSSPFLKSAYHDVPWGEPELFGACVRYAQKHSRGEARPIREFAQAVMGTSPLQRIDERTNANQS